MSQFVGRVWEAWAYVRVTCNTGRRFEGRWLALGGGVGDGEAAGVGGSGGAPAHALGKFLQPCVVWPYPGRRVVIPATITLDLVC